MDELSWHISDEQVVEALRANGFTCEHPEWKPIPGAIHIITSREKEPNPHWWVTSCPIERNTTYTLADGRVLRSFGTTLRLLREDEQP